MAARSTGERDVLVPLGDLTLHGTLVMPAPPSGLVLFAHGSGSGRHSPRNRHVASVLNAAGLATLLFDLLTEAEERDRANVFDVALLADRLARVTAWARRQPGLADLPVGYFGASTGAGAALLAAAGDAAIGAVVSRGGRPDLAPAAALAAVRAPTLLVVGGDDTQVLGLNRRAAEAMTCPLRIAVVPGATHLFEEPGALEQVARLATEWYTAHLGAAGMRPGG